MKSTVWTELVDKIYTLVSIAIKVHKHFYSWDHLPLNRADTLQFVYNANAIHARMIKLATQFMITTQYQMGRELAKIPLTIEEIASTLFISPLIQKTCKNTYLILRKCPFAIPAIRRIEPQEFGMLSVEQAEFIADELASAYDLKERDDDSGWPYENEVFNRLVNIFQGPKYDYDFPAELWPIGQPVPANVNLVLNNPYPSPYTESDSVSIIVVDSESDYSDCSISD